MPKIDPKALLGEVFDEYLATQEGAIVFSHIYDDFIKDKADTDTFTVGELKSKIVEYREVAGGRLSNFRKVIDSFKEKNNVTRSD